MFKCKKGMMMGGYVAAFVFGMILGIILIYAGLKYSILPISLFT